MIHCAVLTVREADTEPEIEVVTLLSSNLDFPPVRVLRGPSRRDQAGVWYNRLNRSSRSANLPTPFPAAG